MGAHDAKALARREAAPPAVREAGPPSAWRRVLGTLVLVATVGLAACETLVAATR